MSSEIYIVSEILGGLGNQMFQYACGLAYSKKINAKHLIDYSAFDKYELRNYQLDSFNITSPRIESDNLDVFQRGPVKSISKFIHKAIRKITGKQFDYNNILFEDWPNFRNLPLKRKCYYLKGYWQSEDYFKEIRDQLLIEFSLKVTLNTNNLNMLNTIKSDSDSVSLHIRRGDYVTGPVDNSLDLSYYHNAIDLIKNRVTNPTFYIFSDDPTWVQENLKLENAHYIDFNKGNEGFFDIELMKNCKHNITANSSFSWWGSWLNENPNKIVIMPKVWLPGETISPNIIYYKDVIKL